MKLKLNSAFTAASGKLCAVEDTYYATNKQTGQCYSARLCNPYQGEPSEKQVAQRQAFATKSKLTAAWMAANKPSTTNADGTEAWQTMLTAYKAQHKVGNTFAFVAKHIKADGTIDIGTATTTNSASAGSQTENPSGTDLDA